MTKEKLKLSQKDRMRADKLIGVIAGAQKELGLIIGRTAKFENTPTVVISTAPVSETEKFFALRSEPAKRAASLSSRSSWFAIFLDGENCMVYNEVEGTCAPCD